MSLRERNWAACDECWMWTHSLVRSGGVGTAHYTPHTSRVRGGPSLACDAKLTSPPCTAARLNLSKEQVTPPLPSRHKNIIHLRSAILLSWVETKCVNNEILLFFKTHLRSARLLFGGVLATNHWKFVKI